MKSLTKLLLIGILIGSILFLISIALQAINNGGVTFTADTFTQFGYFQLYSIVLTFTNALYYDNINRRINWGDKDRLRVGLGTLGGVILSGITIFIIRLVIGVGIKKSDFSAFVRNEFENYGSFYFVSLLIALVVSIFFYAVFYYRESQKNKLNEQKVIAGTASAQFDALKNQLDPHFLFNSLNVLTSLIDENPASAQDFTTALSKVYRYVLEQKNKELVSVDEELNFARIYIRLLKMRFEDSIIFDIPERAQNPEAKVIPLALQLLLENAVKHNVVTASRPLHIKIYEVQGYLVVENNLQVKQMIKKRSGVGLNNIMKRYELITERKVKITQDISRFSVSIPMLTKQIKVKKMKDSFERDEDYIRAKKRVQDIKEFYYGLIAYALVIPFLIFINYRTSWNQFQWFWFPLFGWGVGIGFHAYKVFVNDGIFGSNWEQKKIQEFMREEEKNQWD
ncbi:2TM domain-containing protein [Flavobacteriaceae bacterium F08102]|nr:2TM domain-containing protein [Flavobacteriaceae bacterium F08102]